MNEAPLITAIPTSRKLRSQHRRLDRLIADAQRALKLMEAGAILTYRPNWTLHPGGPIHDEVARLVTKNIYIVPVDGALFDGVAVQTFHWRKNPKEDDTA